MLWIYQFLGFLLEFKVIIHFTSLGTLKFENNLASIGKLLIEPMAKTE